MVVAFESDRHTVDLALAFNINILRAVHHDLGDGVIFQQRLQRAQAEYFSCDLFEQARPLRPGENNVFFRQDLLEQVLYCPFNLIRLGNVHRRIDFSQQFVLYARLQIEIRASLWRRDRGTDPACLQRGQARAIASTTGLTAAGLLRSWCTTAVLLAPALTLFYTLK